MSEEVEWEPPRDWQRNFLGYRERFVEDCVVSLRDGEVTLRIAQAPSASSKLKGRSKGKLDKAADPALTGTTVWDGALVLSHFLTETNVLSQHNFSDPSADSTQPPPLSPTAHLPTCLEVGAGTGTVSLSLLACKCVRHVTITDLADVVPHMQSNVTHNSRVINPRHVAVCPLQWGNIQDVANLHPVKPPFDLIVGSDLIYYTYSEETPHSMLLVETLTQLCGPRSVVYLALGLQHNPDEVQHFLTLAAEAFSVERLQHLVPQEWKIHDTLVVRLMPRQSGVQEEDTEKPVEQDSDSCRVQD